MTGDVLPAAPDGRRAAVVHETDLPMQPIAEGNGTFREPIDATTDCRRLIQRVLRHRPGRTRETRNSTSEDVTFVVAGRGSAIIDGQALDLEPDTGLYVPPSATYRYDIEGPDDLLLLSVLSPQPAERGVGRGLVTRSTGHDLPRSPPATTREQDQPPLPAGDDRYFKLMIDPRFGCRNVTQFLGFIDRSRAPYHTHTYEEVIYILDGEGIVHIDDRHVQIHAGTSIFLPPGVPHCLENASDGVLRLLGVFSPAGSPADKRED